MRPTLHDALIEADRRNLGPMAEALFLDGAAKALHGREPIAGDWDRPTTDGYRWARSRMPGPLGRLRSAIIDRLN